MFRNVTLKCLTEIAGVSVSQYEEQFVTLFTLTMCQLKQVGGGHTLEQWLPKPLARDPKEKPDVSMEPKLTEI